MFLWRLCYDIMPTKENFSKCFIISESSCNLCKNASESACHLFLCCPVAKALWFVVCWGFKFEVVSTSSTKDIAGLVLNLPEALYQTWGHWKVSPTVALILDEIWHLRNAELFTRSNSDLTTSILSIQRKCQEYLTICLVPSPRLKQQNPACWSPPSPGYIKLNTGVALSSTKTALAVIVKDSYGSICNIWTKLLSQRSPLQAESEALLWVVHIANQENWSYIIFESDLKICIDSLSSSVPDSD